MTKTSFLDQNSYPRLSTSLTLNKNSQQLFIPKPISRPKSKIVK